MKLCVSEANVLVKLGVSEANGIGGATGIGIVLVKPCVSEAKGIGGATGIGIVLVKPCVSEAGC